jgi:hypothetical protein
LAKETPFSKYREVALVDSILGRPQSADNRPRDCRLKAEFHIARAEHGCALFCLQQRKKKFICASRRGFIFTSR